MSGVGRRDFLLCTMAGGVTAAIPLREADGSVSAAYGIRLPKIAVEKAAFPSPAVSIPPMPCAYAARGVGGGGAFIGYSASPYQRLAFVGTDMGTLFRSVDGGSFWQPVPNANMQFLQALNGQDYTDLPAPGYSATPNVVFHAPAKGSPSVSKDAGVTWSPMALGSDKVRVRQWFPDSSNPGRVLAGLDDGFAVTTNDGASWTLLASGMGRARGFFLDAGGSVLYVAFADGIYLSRDGGHTLTKVIAEGSGLHRFAGGRGSAGVVFAYVTEPNGPTTGTVYTGGPAGMFPATLSVSGNSTVLMNAEHVGMAENDTTVYAAGARGGGNQYGTSIWKASGTGPFSLVFNSADHGHGVNPWPTLTPSAIGLGAGYWDDGYFTFAVCQTNSNIVGGGELYFLHTSSDGGATWQSPQSHATQAQPGPGQAWTSGGLENCSIRYVKFSAAAPAFGIACGCDYSILVTEDGGTSWRVATGSDQWGEIRNTPHQSCYDVVFDPVDPNTAVCGFSDLHDFQHSGNYGHVGSQVFGGVYVTRDRGRSWAQYGVGVQGSSSPCLSLAQDPSSGAIYAGFQGAGFAVMDASGANWQWMNAGFLDPSPVIAQIEVDAQTGDIYVLAGSDPGMDRSTWQWSGLYILRKGSTTWQQLRGTPNAPYWRADTSNLMTYPTSFALVRGASGSVSGYLVTDAEHTGNYLATGLWLSTDGGNTWNRVQQYTFCTNVRIDPFNPSIVYLSGDTDPGWGTGGALTSHDGGQTFRANTALQTSYGIWSVTADPSDPSSVFYSCFGGGMRHGPKP